MSADKLEEVFKLVQEYSKLDKGFLIDNYLEGLHIKTIHPKQIKKPTMK